MTEQEIEFIASLKALLVRYGITTTKLGTHIVLSDTEGLIYLPDQFIFDLLVEEK